MTQLTARQVADYWVAQGGPKSRAVEWVAIALGESGLRTDAVSSAGAIGLWQIMPFNAPTYGFTSQDLYLPGVSAYVAVHMSGHGANCAAWDSCYADIQASGRYRYLAWPEKGSADYDNLAWAAAALGSDKKYPPVAPMPPAPGQGLGPALHTIDTVLRRDLPALRRQLLRQGMAVSRQWTLGPRS